MCQLCLPPNDLFPFNFPYALKGYGFRTPGNDGTIVDVPELVAARKGLKVMHSEDTYQQMIDHFEECACDMSWHRCPKNCLAITIVFCSVEILADTDVAGDHPLNMGSTTQVLNAYALTGEQKYYDHIVDYISAWYFCQSHASELHDESLLHLLGR
eukprot:SAG31_NODE_138_length_22877_cov_29.540917_15_plen_156_part_00